jgi:hypothetical protein
MATSENLTASLGYFMAIFGNPFCKIFDRAESDSIEGWEMYIQDRRKGKGTEEKEGKRTGVRERKRDWREGGDKGLKRRRGKGIGEKDGKGIAGRRK